MFGMAGGMIRANQRLHGADEYATRHRAAGTDTTSSVGSVLSPPPLPISITAREQIGALPPRFFSPRKTSRCPQSRHRQRSARAPERGWPACIGLGRVHSISTIPPPSRSPPQAVIGRPLAPRRVAVLLIGRGGGACCFPGRRPVRARGGAAPRRRTVRVCRFV